MRHFLAIAILGTMVGCSKPNATPVTSTSAPQQSADNRPSALNAAPAAAPAPAPAPEPQPIVLPAGTVVRVRTTNVLSTKSSRPGDGFMATLVEPVSINGKVVVPRGATVRGVVANSDPGGRVKGRAHLAVRLVSLQADTRTVSIATNSYYREAPGTKKRDAMKIGIGSGAGAAIGAIAGGGFGAAVGAAAGAGAGTGYVLATHGAPAVIPSESVLSFRLQSAATL